MGLNIVIHCNASTLEVMDMKTVSVRLNAEEERAFTAYADLMGEPLSTLFKKLMEEKLEDEFDMKVAEDFLEIEARGEVEYITHEELMNELDF